MPPVGPAYDLAEFIAACVDPATVVVLHSASKTAVDLGLHTDLDILQWIQDGAIHKPEHINTKPWERNPDDSVEILVDAYNFHNKFNVVEYCYLAFMFRENRGLWLIKSLKLNDKPTSKVFPFAGLAKLMKEPR